MCCEDAWSVQPGDHGSPHNCQARSFPGVTQRIQARVERIQARVDLICEGSGLPTLPSAKYCMISTSSGRPLPRGLSVSDGSSAGWACGFLVASSHCSNIVFLEAFLYDSIIALCSASVKESASKGVRLSSHMSNQFP